MHPLYHVNDVISNILYQLPQGRGLPLPAFRRNTKKKREANSLHNGIRLTFSFPVFLFFVGQTTSSARIPCADSFRRRRAGCVSARLCDEQHFTGGRFATRPTVLFPCAAERETLQRFENALNQSHSFEGRHGVRPGALHSAALTASPYPLPRSSFQESKSSFDSCVQCNALRIRSISATLLNGVMIYSPSVYGAIWFAVSTESSTAIASHSSRLLPS